MLVRGFHLHLFGHLVTFGHGHIFAHRLLDGFQNLVTVLFGHIMALGYRHLFGLFDRHLMAHLFRYHVTSMVTVAVMSIGLRFGLGLGFSSPAASAVAVIAVVAVVVSGVVVVGSGFGADLKKDFIKSTFDNGNFEANQNSSGLFCTDSPHF